MKFTLAAYLRDHAWQAALAVVTLAALCGIGSVCGLSLSAVALMAAVGVAASVAAFALDFARRRAFYAELNALTRELSTTWQLPALLEAPDFLEGAVAYAALERMGKAAGDEVEEGRRQAEEYRRYVELWIHEVKTPIAVAALVAANESGEASDAIKRELERIEQQVEQALYYARSTSLTNDYAIREILLADACREACKKNARFLIEQGATPTFEALDDVRVFADEKWLVFVLGQVLANAAKYGAKTVRFTARNERENTAKSATVLEIADDGKGIPAADVPRVFDRGFTGENGRAQGSSTGMGLYLCAVMCEKMGLGIALASEQGKGTRVLLTFPHDRRRMDALTNV